MNTPELVPTRTRRPRPQVVSLTDAAAERVRDVMAKSEKPYLRVGIKNGGCAGMEYVMAYADCLYFCARAAASMPNFAQAKASSASSKAVSGIAR